MALNHYAINQIIQGKMVLGGRTRFGRIGLLGTTANMLKHRPRPNVRVTPSLESDKLAYQAFLKVHDGASPETVLIDPALALKFHAAARKLGYHASAADLNRRILNIRKNPARYRAHGLIIPEATKTDPHPSIVPRYAHVIEFSLARLHSRYGVTIDDVLIDPALTDEYEKMARIAAPSLSSQDLRLAALYVRKTRFIAKANLELVRSLDEGQIETAFKNVVAGTVVEEKPGLIEVLEQNRHLYISRNENLHSAVDQILSESSLNFMANDFWKPKRENLSVRVLTGEKFMNVPVTQWQLKLISVKRPVFNWPVTQ